MNDQPPTLPRRQRGPSARGWLVIGGCVLFVAAMQASRNMIRPRPDQAKQEEAIHAISNVRDALKAYLTEYGVHPEGDQARIMASLCGDNPKGIVFFDRAGRRFNDRGEFLDPWESPYHIDVRLTDYPRVYSWGRNGQDDGGRGDDLESAKRLPADPLLSPPKKHWYSRF